MTSQQSADPMAILAQELKGLGGMEPAYFASRFKGCGSVSQAYRDLLAARVGQARLFRRLGRGGERGDQAYGDRFAALEAKARDSLDVIRVAG